MNINDILTQIFVNTAKKNAVTELMNTLIENDEQAPQKGCDIDDKCITNL